jgi:hypothetical protein
MRAHTPEQPLDKGILTTDEAVEQGSRDSTLRGMVTRLDHIPAQGVPAVHEGRWRWLKRFVLLWESPIVSMLLAFMVYAMITAQYGSIWRESLFAYYNYLADALLHGQLYLRNMPVRRLDLSLYQGRYYLYWGPLPAVLLMPLIALFGVHFSDIFFTLLIGAGDVALLALLLRRACRAGVISLVPIQRGLLVLFFALGTVHIMLAPFGRIWFTSQLIAFACVALAYLAVLTQRGWPAFALAGLALAGALLTRNNLVLAGIWPACYLIYQHWPARWLRLISYAIVGALPIVVGVVLLGLYNWLRFGSIFDNGIAHHLMELSLVSDYRQYGAFSLHYLPINLFYQYIAYPFPIQDTSFHGSSLFLLSPVFFAVFWGAIYGRPRWSAWALAGTIILVNLPILLVMGTGWPEFGPRYTLDFTVPLLLLAAMGVRRWPTWLLALLTGISIVSYIIGTLTLGYNIAQ